MCVLSVISAGWLLGVVVIGRQRIKRERDGEFEGL